MCLTTALLRLQCLERAQAHREAALHASQSGEARLVLEPEQWEWSSFRSYAGQEAG
jgi:hypothetical protein